MRALLLLSIAALVCLPAASALPGPPTLAIKIDQTSQRVNASNSNSSVVFTGSVTVTKSPYLSATVTLKGIVDRGWNSSVEPASMTFTSTSPQAFTCTVTVPAGTPGATDAQLVIDGTIQSGILLNNATASAMITVTGTLPPPANQTGNGTGGTKPGGGNNTTVIPTGLGSTPVSDVIFGFNYIQWAGMGLAAAVALTVIVVAVRVRRKKNAALTVDVVEDG